MYFGLMELKLSAAVMTVFIFGGKKGGKLARLRTVSQESIARMGKSCFVVILLHDKLVNFTKH